MYKYTLVLFVLMYSPIVFTRNKYTNGFPNSITEYSNEEPQTNDDSSEPQGWVYKNRDITKFNYEPRSDYDRIIFPEDNQESDKNDRDHNIKSNLERFIHKCKRLCPLKKEYDPVCGTDDVTYYNLDLLQCVRDCGQKVALKYLSACNEVTSTQPSPTTNDYIRSCISTCPTTSEYNPVCGTDDVTYNNIGKLTCAQICGVEVQLRRRSPCPKKEAPEDQFPTSVAPPTSTLDSRQFRLCLDSCITTSEYNPVCGSDGKTYYNQGKYRCAKGCGLDISIRRLGSCLQPEAPEEVPTATSSSDTTTSHHIDRDSFHKVFYGEDPSTLLDVRSA